MQSQRTSRRTHFNHPSAEAAFLSLLYRQGKVFSWGSICPAVLHGRVRVVLRQEGNTVKTSSGARRV